MSVPVDTFVRGEESALRTHLDSRPEKEMWCLICEGWVAPVEEVPGLRVHLISGCACCIGKISMQVTMNRVLRQEKPARVVLYIVGHVP